MYFVVNYDYTFILSSNATKTMYKILIIVFVCSFHVDLEPDVNSFKGQIIALLARSLCRVSETQVTVKACGPLVSVVFDEYDW